MKTHAKSKDDGPLCGNRHSGPHKKPLTFDPLPTCLNCIHVLTHAEQEARSLTLRAEQLRSQAEDLDLKAAHLKKLQREALQLGYRPPVPHGIWCTPKPENHDHRGASWLMNGYEGPPIEFDSKDEAEQHIANLGKRGRLKLDQWTYEARPL